MADLGLPRTRDVAVIGTGFRPSETGQPPAEIAAIARPPYRPVLVETRLSVFPGTPFERGVGALGYVEAAVRAWRDGAAAIYVNTFGDYGIDEMRSALPIPVVGAGEATLAMGATLGRRFAIVTIWPSSLNFIYHERLAATRMADRCVGLVNVLDEAEMARLADADGPVDQMRGGEGAMVERIVKGMRHALTLGADTILLGCTCMGPIARSLADRMDVPVVDAMTTGYLAAEQQLQLGLRQSPVAYPRAAPARLAMLDALLAGELPPQEAECEVCVTAEAAA